MQNVLRALMLAALISIGAGIPGCAGGTEDEVLDYDPEASEKHRAEYDAKMKEAMQKQGRPAPQAPQQ